MITIYRRSGAVATVVCTIADDNATHPADLMGKDELTVDVTTESVLPVRVLDYIYYNSIVYTLNREPEFTKVSDVEYKYLFTFEHPKYALLDKGYAYPITNQTRFWLTGTLRDFVELAVTNINQIDTGWTVGVIPETSRKNIQFESFTCGDVLNKLANEFTVEYHIDGKQINFYDRYENHTSLVFEQGKGKGLYTLSRQNVDTDNTITRAVLYGGTKNLPPGYRGGSEYLRWADPDTGNMYVENFDDYPKVVERDVYFDDVYPRFEGSVDAVRGDHNQIVRCNSINFDINSQLIGGVTAKINFVTGDLTGCAFELTYNHAAREVTLIRQEDETALADADGNRPLIPNATRRPRPGDEINFTDILLPDEYVKRKEEELHIKGVEWLNMNSQQRVKFDLDVDYRYLRREGIALHIGDVVRIKVPENGIDRRLRIISLETKLKTGSITCEVSNYPKYSWEKEIEGKIQSAKDKVEVIRSEVQYDINASKEWTGRNFARLYGGNRMTGTQEIDDLLADIVRAETVESDLVKSALVRSDEVEFGKLKTADFTPGPLGAGIGTLNGDEFQTDKLLVRKEMTVLELIVQKMRHQGGQMILSPAGIKISAVEDGGSYWKCYFENDGGNILNEFVADDQARINNFTGGDQKYLWARVTSVGEDYVNLSKTDKDGNGIPAAGDHLVQLGHRSNTDRQDAVVISSTGGEVGIVTYHGINSFSMSDKEGSWFGKHGGEKGAVVRGRVLLTSGQSVEDYTQQKMSEVESSATTAALQVMEGSITMKVSEAVSNIKTSGRNLLTDSIGMSDFYPGGGNILSSNNPDPFGGNSATKISLTTGSTTPFWDFYRQYLSLIPGNEYTVSVWVKLETAPNFVITLNDTTDWFTINKQTEVTGTGWQRAVIAFIAPINGRLNIHLGGSPESIKQYAGTVLVCGFQLEHGNVATDWSRSPEDMATKAELSSEIKQTADKITLAINSIQAGSRNFALNSKSRQRYSAGYVEYYLSPDIVDKEISLTVTYTATAGGWEGNGLAWATNGVRDDYFAFHDIWGTNTYSATSIKPAGRNMLMIWFNSAAVTVTDLSVQQGDKIIGAWSYAPEDALATGLDIANRRFTATADTFVVQDNSGKINTVFEDGKIRADCIDAGNIEAGKLRTKDVSATNKAHVEINDSIVVCDSTGVPKLSILTGAIPALSALGGNPAASSASIVGAGFSNTGTLTLGQLTIPKDVTSTVTVAMSGIYITAFTHGAVGAMASVDIYLEGGGVSILLGSGSAYAEGTQYAESSKEYSFSISAVRSFTPGAITTLSIVARASFINPGESTISIIGGTMSFITITKEMVYLGADGIAAVFGSDKYFYLSRNAVGDTILALKGITDMPGVLASGRVNQVGGDANRWGAKLTTAQAIKLAVGQYRIYHSIGHSDYSVVVTPVYSTTPCIAQIYAKATTFVDIYITNYSGTLRDNAFDFIITGKN